MFFRTNEQKQSLHSSDNAVPSESGGNCREASFCLLYSLSPPSSAPATRLYLLSPIVHRVFPLTPIVICILTVLGSGADGSMLHVSPAKVALERPEATQQIVIRQDDATGRLVDITRDVKIRIDPPQLAEVDDRGLVFPRANGVGTIIIDWKDRTQSIPITVSRLDAPLPISFRNEVMPILTKTACNSGGCHGKAEGQNGFKLSIFGFDPRADHEALVMEGRGRRISVGQLAASLVFQKASARVPHGGGQKIEPGSYRDRRLLRWISEGARFDAVDDASTRITGIEIEPQQQILLGGESHQIRVNTIDVQGNRCCVTNETEYESNAAAIADVDSRGLIQAGRIPGEAAILVRHLGHVATCRITLPRPGVTFPRPGRKQFHRRAGLGQTQTAGHRTRRPFRRRHVPASRLPGYHRNTADVATGAAVHQ